MVRNTLVFLLLLHSLLIYAYPIRVTRIESKFKDLYHTDVQRFIYLTSDIKFKIKQNDQFKLFRKLPLKDKETVDICIATITITHIVPPLIQARKINNCDREKLPLTELKSIQINDFIDIKTALDHLKKIPKENIHEDHAAILFASLLMQGIDPDFNVLLYENFTTPPPKKVSKINPIKSSKRSLKKLPRKKRKNPKKYSSFFQDVDL